MHGIRWRSLIALLVCSWSGCGAATSRAPTVAVRPGCQLTEVFVAGRCQSVAGRVRLEAGRAALAKFEVEVASAELNAAAAAGPLDYDSHIALWEQRGIAAAYSDDETTALRAFDMLLTLDPGHLLSYTLSPRATFVFEKARLAGRRVQPEVQLTWRRDARIGDALPIDIEVVADPKRALQRASLLVRSRGEPAWRAIDLELRARGAVRRVMLPATAGQRAATLELYLRVFDQSNNEVLRWASPQAPREIALRYDPPLPWHRKGWVRALAGATLALVTGSVVYAVTREPPNTVGGEVIVK
jgi:hypothetical protein